MEDTKKFDVLKEYLIAYCDQQEVKRGGWDPILTEIIKYAEGDLTFNYEIMWPLIVRMDKERKYRGEDFNATEERY
tara:strand:- start:3945 stop:4172 length:228 start_codon:yes stop_codon:yes gene_type:complete